MNSYETVCFYNEMGYKVIPLFFQTKTPIFKNWNTKYDCEIIKSFFQEQECQLNYGLLLGDIIDIEGDCFDSNKHIDELLKDYEHPCFQSKKSKHHLFRSTIKNLTRIVIDGVEFRGHRHQSVIPPSMHEDGQKYEWVSKIYHFNDIPWIPKHIEEYIRNKISSTQNVKFKNKVKPNHTSLRCPLCAKNIFINKNRLAKEMIFLKSQKIIWSCNKCRNFDFRKEIKHYKFQ
jgi:hypothetical protein